MLILISDAFGPDLPERLARFGEVTSDKDRAPLLYSSALIAKPTILVVRSWKWSDLPNVPSRHVPNSHRMYQFSESLRSGESS